MSTAAQALRQAGAALTKTSDAPDTDAQRILLHVLGRKDTSWLFAHPEYELSVEKESHYRQLVAQRRDGKPLAYILGTAGFYGREFLVNEHVLIPRPETENLVDAALEYVKGHMSHVNGPFTIADIGTGSGCIITTLACELANFQFPISNFQFLATDISAPALAVAEANATRHGVAESIEFLQGNLLEPLQGRNIDLIVSNPPYVPSKELDRPEPRGVQGKLETLGLKFEPRLALDGGADGQQYIDQIKKAGIPTIMETTNGRVERYL